jgi:hypothetical protein
MGVNDEKLKVQFEVDLEQLKKQLGQAGVIFDQTAKKTEQSTQKMAAGIEVVEKKSGFLVAKLTSIGKAAAAAFAFDLAAKVFGFSGVMDLVSKATDKAAETIRLAGQYVLGLGDSADAADVKVKRLADRIAEIRGALRTTEDFTISPRRGEGFAIEIPKFQNDADNLKALEAVERAQKRIRDLSDEAARSLGAESYAKASGAIREVADEFARIESDQIIEGVRAEFAALSKEVAEAPAKLKAATDAHNAWVKSLERGAALTAKARAEAGVVRFANPFANVGASAADAAVTATRQRAFNLRSEEIKAAERDSARLEQFAQKAIAVSQFVASAGVKVFNELETVRRQREADLALSQQFVEAYAVSLERTRLEAELASDPFDQLNAALVQISDTAESRRLNLYQQFVADGDQEKLREFLDLVDRIEAKQIAATKATGTFAGQVDARMKQIAESISNIGGQTVDVAFNSFRGFFRDILSGTASAGEAFRSFAASVVAGLADMLAQWLALQAVGFLFPGFGAAGGSVFGASRAGSGGTGAGAGGAPIYGFGSGAAGGGFGAQRGGGPVTINLVVQSLDPRTAADVVLGAMPQIQGALAAVISGGSDRRLLEQLRAVRG